MWRRGVNVKKNRESEQGEVEPLVGNRRADVCGLRRRVA